MTTAYLARVRLSPATTPGRLIETLRRRGDTANPEALAHHLIWTLFPGRAKNDRPFLYRDDGNGTYIVISRDAAPRNDDGLFVIDGPREFLPQFNKDDILRFRLRANPVIRTEEEETRVTEKGRVVPKRRKRDVVMHHLRPLPKAERARERQHIIQVAGREWVEHTGKGAGFTLAYPETLQIDNYRQQRICRQKQRSLGPKKIWQQFSTLDFEGLLAVTEPERFAQRLVDGFGSAKGFGCGLMLVRKA